jgi:hypothetical protein
MSDRRSQHQQPRGGSGIPAPPPMIQEDEVQKCLDFLWESASQIGRARARQARAEHMVKVHRSMGVLHSGESTVDKREAEALTSKRYEAAVTELHDATLDAETLYAKRRHAELTIDAWRTSESTRRAIRI